MDARHTPAPLADKLAPDCLLRLDTLLKEAIGRARRIYQSGGGDEAFHGLYISEQEIDTLVDRTDAVGSPSAAAEFLTCCESLPAIDRLSNDWQLTPFDHAVLILALAPEIDLRYERLYAYLQDDVTRRKPTVDLALTLLSADPAARMANRSRFAADAPLLRSGLVRLVADPAHVDPPLLAHYIRLDEPVVAWLLGTEDPDARLSSFCEVVSTATAPNEPTDTIRTVVQYVAAASRTSRAVRLHFAGPEASSKIMAARAIAAAVGTPLVAADLARSPLATVAPATIASWLTREASRTGAVLYVDGIDEAADPAVLRPLIDDAVSYRGVVIVASESAAMASILARTRFLRVAFPWPDYDGRRAAWQAETAAAGIAVEPATISTLANHFKYSRKQIAAVVASARQSLDWRAAGNSGLSPRDGVDALLAAARAQSGVELAGLTQKVCPVYRWSDLVLPANAIDQLKEICQRVSYRHDVLERGGFGRKLSSGKGVTVLFAGPSGTGKTMAAEVIANELNLNLFRINLSTVVSKYIGETEKNLEKIFAAAEHSNCVLLFDEADALCGKRSEVRDAHDRYANIEISYLLQKMEQHEDGLTILTTNLRGNLDESFVRRLAFTVHFPFPGEADRLRIWKQIWPEETPLDPSLDLGVIARRFKLSGGNIKNVALATAFLAAAESRPVRMSDILHSTRREYEKVGQIVTAEEIEAAVH